MGKLILNIHEGFTKAGNYDGVGEGTCEGNNL